MSKDWYQDVADFHKDVAGDSFPNTPYTPNKQLRELRMELIREEVQETIDAIATHPNDLALVADGIGDSIVVLLGTAVTYGIDMRPIWDIIHKTNMAKKGGKLREDGKLLKPDKWQPPDIQSEIEKQQKRQHNEMVQDA